MITTNCKPKMPFFCLQGMTNNVRLTIGVGDTKYNIYCS